MSSLIKIDEEIVTSAVASVELGGTNWDSSYDVYMVKINNVIFSVDSVTFSMRFLASSTPDTSSNYDLAQKTLRSLEVFGNEALTNQDKVTLGAIGNATGEQANGIYYLFNFNNASEYSFGTKENAYINANGDLKSENGGFVLTVAQANNGVQFNVSSGNINQGTFTLYGLKK